MTHTESFSPALDRFGHYAYTLTLFLSTTDYYIMHYDTCLLLTDSVVYLRLHMHSHIHQWI